MRFLVFALIVFCGTVSANASYIVNISSGSYTSDGVNPTSGSFDLVLNLTGAELASPPTITDFTARYNFSQPALTINSINFVGSGSGGLNYTNSPVTFSPFMSSTFFGISALPVTAPAFDGAILGRVNFTASAGFSGPIAMTLASPTTAFNSVAATGNNGSISITAVPEPSSMALLGLGAFGFAFRRRRV